MDPGWGSFFFFFLFVCFTRYLVFRIAFLPHRPGVVYYHLLLRRETRIPGVAPFSFRIGIWDLFVHRGQKSYTPTAFGKLWTTPGVRCMKPCDTGPPNPIQVGIPAMFYLYPDPLPFPIIQELPLSADTKTSTGNIFRLRQRTSTTPVTNA